MAAAAAATGVGVGAGEKMKSVILYPYGPLTGTGCCRMLHAKNLALTSAIYTIVSIICMKAEKIPKTKKTETVCGMK